VASTPATRRVQTLKLPGSKQHIEHHRSYDCLGFVGRIEHLKGIGSFR